HIVLAAEPFGRINAAFHSRRGKSENVRIGIGCRARHIAAVGEQVRRAPEKLYAGFCLLLLEDVDDLVQIARIFRKVASLWPHIGIVEAIIGRAEQREELESHLSLEFCRIKFVGIPWTVEGASAER